MGLLLNLSELPWVDKVECVEFQVVTEHYSHLFHSVVNNKYLVS